MYTCTCMRTHTCKCAHAHTCIHTHTHTHTCKHTHTHTHASAHMHTLPRTRACTHARARGRTGLLHFTNVETGLEGSAGFWGKRVVDRGWELVSIFASVPHGGALIATGGPEILTGYACWFQNGLVWHGLLGRSRCFLRRRKRVRPSSLRLSRCSQAGPSLGYLHTPSLRPGIFLI